MSRSLTIKEQGLDVLDPAGSFNDKEKSLLSGLLIASKWKRTSRFLWGSGNKEWRFQKCRRGVSHLTGDAVSDSAAVEVPLQLCIQPSWLVQVLCRQERAEYPDGTMYDYSKDSIAQNAISLSM